MLQFRCTKKALDALGLKPGVLNEIKEPDSVLGNWYVNLFTIDRRKTLIMMNERTLLSFMIYGVRKDNIKNFAELFHNGLDQLLTIEGIDREVIGEILSQYQTTEFTKTNSRSILGNLNDLMDLYKHSILYEGGLKKSCLTSIIQKINRTPQRNLGWKNSIETTLELLKMHKHQTI